MSRVAIVTGSNKGIGFAVVRELCKKFEGDVLLCSRDEKRGQNAVAKLESEGLHPKLAILDISDNESIQNLKKIIADTYGGIDVLVNNAAIAYPNVCDVPFPIQARNTLKINYFATLEICKAFFPLLRPHARVVNVSSSCGLLNKVPLERRNQFTDVNLTEEKLTSLVNEYLSDVDKNQHLEKGWPRTAYNMSKVSLTALTMIQHRNLVKDQRQDIIINAVHPGYVDTDMSNHKGPLTIEEGAKSSVMAALIPPNADGPKGQFFWFDGQVIDWTTFEMK